ncbi:MAG: protease complex subunit PrcB family protein [Actinobacteria bacterium]|nr:protease complex subunit PrcB family protein [Actinomycetota bacterium]
MTGAALGWVAWQGLWAHGGDTPIRWVDLTERTLAQPAHAGLRVFRAREPLVEELRSDGRSATIPPIDFRRRTAILVSSGPRSSTAYELKIIRVVEERRRIVVMVRERTPSLAVPGAATLTFPFRLITIERSGKSVAVGWKGRP